MSARVRYGRDIWGVAAALEIVDSAETDNEPYRLAAHEMEDGPRTRGVPSYINNHTFWLTVACRSSPAWWLA
jgi:hypothetical protein